MIKTALAQAFNLEQQRGGTEEKEHEQTIVAGLRGVTLIIYNRKHR